MTIKKTLLGLTLTMSLASCSVQQFAVNTTVQPFEKGGKLIGEKTQGKNIVKSGDLHVLGFNLINSDTQKMAEALNATSYTIETKSNLILDILTCGMVDYKVVKLIRREN